MFTTASADLFMSDHVIHMEKKTQLLTVCGISDLTRSGPCPSPASSGTLHPLSHHTMATLASFFLPLSYPGIFALDISSLITLSDALFYFLTALLSESILLIDFLGDPFLFLLLAFAG
ncbi:hypothetical protein H1C71_028290 [Ictidomys tridecemlineatus]|nr:hypothetical protein H1C71_028290 [Ictidomys tridecemlineatus]